MCLSLSFASFVTLTGPGKFTPRSLFFLGSKRIKGRRLVNPHVKHRFKHSLNYSLKLRFLAVLRRRVMLKSEPP